MLLCSTHADDDSDGFSMGRLPLECGCMSGELGTENSPRMLAVSGSTSEKDPWRVFFREKALVNELRNWKYRGIDKYKLVSQSILIIPASAKHITNDLHHHHTWSYSDSYIIRLSAGFIDFILCTIFLSLEGNFQAFQSHVII